MKKLIAKSGICCALFLLSTMAAKAQADTAGEFKPHGKLWGYAFGDYAFKGGTDEAKRGGSNQYTGVALNTNMFQWRRIYLGYNYDISRKFAAEFLLAAEDNWAGGVVPGTGDVLANNKLAPYVKLANIRWRNLWRGTDLVFGQQATPIFAQGSALKENARNSGSSSEEIWGYRSIERTMVDIRRTSSYDFGLGLQGWIDKNGNYGYDLLMANGTGAKAETDNNKWFYGDVYAKFFKKRLVVQFAADYNRMHWSPIVNGQPETAVVGATSTTYIAPGQTGGPAISGLHHDRNMGKIFVAWVDKKFTVGAEAFENVLMGDVQAIGTDHKAYYLTTKSMGFSVFAKGRIYKDYLGFFARYDSYDPSGNLSAITGNSGFTSYSALTSQYDLTTKEQFVTLGVDYTPIKNVHIMPNIWMNTYDAALTSSEYGLNKAGGTAVKGTDMVYRLTIYYVYGK